MHRPPLLAISLTLSLLAGRAMAEPFPVEPLEIGHEPQFVFDLYVVDTTWGLKPKGEPVRRVFHPAIKHPGNPLITGDDPSHLWILHDNDGQFRMWYQANVKTPGGRAIYHTSIAYAESSDGLHWEKPALDLFPDAASSNVPRNAVIHRPEAPQCTSGAPQIVDVPDKDRHGFRYIMFYTMSRAPLNGLRLIGSHDGIHWETDSDRRIVQLPSDTHNTIVYDPEHDEYAMFCRSKHIYRALGEGKAMIDSGESRRGMSRMTSKELWHDWTIRPQTILMPDERDADLGYNYFMAMPVHRFASIWWGALAPFLWNDLYASEFAWSRDGWHFERLPAREHLIEFGAAGTWDHSMICASPRWVEVGDEWWIYYAGFNGPHDDPAGRTGAIGVAKVRKEGFISQHGPKTGGVVCTRALRWPGGKLMVNADAHAGELKVRVSDELRRPITGFNYDDVAPFTGDRVAQEITWKEQSLDALKGRTIRLEFQLKDADLYSFTAAAAE